MIPGQNKEHRPMREEALESGLMNPFKQRLYLRYQVVCYQPAPLRGYVHVFKDLGLPLERLYLKMGERYKVATKETKRRSSLKIWSDCKTVQSGSCR